MKTQNLKDLVIIGAGAAGIALAAEECAVGHDSTKVLILEKGIFF
jgi:cation diffusion facilitator CzcD-associated flavoprotein CzcO